MIDEKTTLESTSEGFFFVDARDKYIGRGITQYGVWEAPETAWFKTVVRDGDLVIDAGANLGWYTVIAARLVGARGCVLSFEPDPYNYSLLVTNVAKNSFSKRCQLFQLALLEQSGICRLELSPNNLGDHRVRFSLPVEAKQNRFFEDQRSTIAVKCDSLDGILRRCALQDKQIRLLKIDCQGSEAAILKGSRHALDRTDYLLSEYWPYALDRSPYTASDFLECVTPFFCEFARLIEGQMNFKPIEKLRYDLASAMSTHEGVDAYTMYVFRKKGII